MIKISDWYVTFSDITFLSTFIKLSSEEKNTIINNSSNEIKKNLWQRMKKAIASLPRGVIINADCVAPTDSPAFKNRPILHTPISSWLQLTTSEKVKNALKNNESDYLVYRPYRRIDRFREFRLFVKDKKLIAASQYHLIKYNSKLLKHQDFYWNLIQHFFNEKILPRLEYSNVAIDIYICANNDLLIIDFNDLSDNVKPLLLRKSENINDEFFMERHRLMLLTPPSKMNGDVSISF